MVNLIKVTKEVQNLNRTCLIQLYIQLCIYLIFVGVTGNKYTIQKTKTSSEPIDKALMKFQFRTSIILTKSKINTSNSFSFTEIETDMLIKKYVP